MDIEVVFLSCLYNFADVFSVMIRDTRFLFFCILQKVCIMTMSLLFQYTTHKNINFKDVLVNNKKSKERLD